MNNKYKLSIILISILSLSSSLYAELFTGRGYDIKKTYRTKTKDSIPEHTKPTTNRLEIDYSYDSLKPNDINGDWHTVMISDYQKIEQGFTLFSQIGLFKRKSKNALLASMGAYKDWSDTFYTFTQLTLGTSSEYLPRFRIDNDFNFKFGEKKNIVYLLGLTYIKAYDTHSDKIISTGLTYYAPMYNLSYRFFRNQSDPGNVVSYSHNFSAGYGKEKSQWTYLNFSFGNPSYLSTLTSTYQKVQQDAFNIELTYRKWTTNTSGFYSGLSYFNLTDGYKKTHLKIGYFLEY